MCCVLGFLLSCQDDHEKSVFKTSSNVDPDLVIAQKNLDDFVKFIGPQTRNFGSELTILSVDKKGLPLKLKDSLMTLQTRSARVELKDSAYLYTFTFTKGEHKGYAIVSGEEKVPKLYAYVEKGNLADTVINGGLRQALGMIDEIYQDDVLGAYLTGASEENSSISTYGNPTLSLTKLEWNQCLPYNQNIRFLLFY